MRLGEDWRVVVGVVSGGHLMSHFYALSLPPLFPLLRAEFGLSNTELGLLMSIVSMAGLLQMPVGRVVDRIGPRRVFVAGMAITATGITLAGFAGSYLALLGAVLVSGLGQSTFHPADYAMIEAVTDPEHEGKSFSAHVFGGYAGFAAGPAIVGTIGLLRGWRTALAVAGTFGLAYAAVSWVALDSSVVDRRSGREAGEEGGLGLEILKQPGFLVLFLFFAVLTMASKGIQTFTGILVVDGFDLAESVGNATLTGFFVGAAAGVLVGGVLADRYTPRRIIAAALSVAGIATWAGASGVLPIGALSAVGLFSAIGFSVGLVFPARDRLVSALSTAGSTGTSFGFVFTGLSLGGLTSPVLLGAVIDFTTAATAFAIVGVFYLLAAGIGFGVKGAARSPLADASQR